MPTLKGSQTEKNLLGSFAGESQARNRYTYFASVAKKEGLVQMADIFAETVDQGAAGQDDIEGLAGIRFLGRRFGLLAGGDKCQRNEQCVDAKGDE